MIDLEKLKEPFSSKDIEWRVQADGVKGDKVWSRVLAYVTARAVQERLDEVCGVGNWSDTFKHIEGGVMCGISIRIERKDEEHIYSEWVTKWDGSQATNIEAFKGGISKALVRCGSKWGVGRYLYNLESSFADITEKGSHYVGKHTDKWKNEIPAYKWDAPSLPTWALPKDDKGGNPPDPKPTPKTEMTKKQLTEKLSEMPTLIKDYFKAQNYSTGDVRKFCENYSWDWDVIQVKIEDNTDAPS